MNQLRAVGSVSARKAVVADFCSVRNLCLEQAQHQCLVYKKLSYWSTKVSRYCLRQGKPFCLDVAPGRAQYKQLLDNENVFFCVLEQNTNKDLVALLIAEQVTKTNGLDHKVLKLVKNSHHLYIHRFFVSPSYQRMSLGKLLIGALNQWSNRSDIKGIAHLTKK